MADGTIGIVGPGRMGLAMVRHLIKGGYKVAATDLNREQLDKAVAEGAAACADAAELARNCDYAIVAVGYDDEVRAVTMGPDGLLAGMGQGGCIAVCSTAAPDTVKEIETRGREQGIAVLDAPICRGRWAADDGTLLALVGGAAETVERSLPVFRTFCSDIVDLGDVGHGQVGKAMNNFLLWVNGVALIEAGRLAESTGIDLVKLREALMMSSGDSAALRDWDRMSFTWALKDMQVLSKMTDSAGLSLPIVGAIRELVKEGRRIKATNPPDWTGEGGIPTGL